MKEDKPLKPKLEGLESVTDVYVDGFEGVAVCNGVVKLNMFADWADPEGNRLRRRAVQRLVLPLQTLLQMHAALEDLIVEFERDGLVHREETGDGA